MTTGFLTVVLEGGADAYMTDDGTIVDLPGVAIEAHFVHEVLVAVTLEDGTYQEV